VARFERRRPPFWVWNAPLRQLYMSSYHLAPEFAAEYAAALARYRITYLWGYSSALHALALALLGAGITGLKMRLALSNAEPLFDAHRAAIGQAFGCPVRETYGMAEMAVGASECEYGSLHMWPDAGIVETLSEAAESTSGEFVVTSLLKTEMPLIRYRIGDCGLLAPAGTACACGRTLPVLSRLDGRLDDTLYTADGRAVGRMDPVFKRGLPVREAQIIQETLDRVRVRFVPAAGWDHAASEALRGAVRARLGPVDVIAERVASIPRTANGKFRAVVCAIPPSERPAPFARREPVQPALRGE
jgi:phenylacetate-CoA ligase